MRLYEILTEAKAVKQRLDPKCWKGKHKEGTKIKGGVRVNNCVPNESVEESFNSKQEVINHFVKQGKSAASGAAAWERGWRGHTPTKKELKPPTRSYHDDLDDKRYNEELEEEFDLIESIISKLAENNNVDAEEIWEDLESLTEDELYVFAVTSNPVTEDWQKANKKDKTDGMSKKAVNAYRREHPGSKLKTAVTTKPSKLKKGSKASKRRSSYCSRSKGQMKMHNISCAKTPDKAICKARRRWNC